MAICKRTVRSAAVALAIAACAGVATRAPAATIRVPADHPTINQAMDAASFGDTVLMAPGVYDDFETRDGVTAAGFLKDGVALVSEDGSVATTISMVYAGSNSSVLVALSLQSDETVVEGFTITGQAPFATGLAAGGCEKITVRGCRFVDLDNGLQDGGGIWAPDTDLYVIDCHFLRCVTTADAAGIFSVDAELVVDSCVFEECTGGAIRAIGSTFVFSGGSVTNSVFLNNTGITGGERSRCVRNLRSRWKGVGSRATPRQGPAAEAWSPQRPSNPPSSSATTSSLETALDRAGAEVA